MIRTYGLHWHVDRVNWGRRNSAGELLGSASNSLQSHPVDFRLQRGIYALYADYDLVYVGQAGGRTNNRLFDRLKAHRNDHLSERWNRFSWFGTQWVTQAGLLSKDAATMNQQVGPGLNLLEAVAIAISEPRLNLQRGAWGRNSKKYFQWYKEDRETE